MATKTIRDPDPDFLRVSDVAARLSKSTDFVYDLCYSGALAYVVMGGRKSMRIPIESYRAYCAGLLAAGSQAGRSAS